MDGWIDVCTCVGWFVLSCMTKYWYAHFNCCVMVNYGESQSTKSPCVFISRRKVE